MVTESWPAVGENGFTADHWMRAGDSPDGIWEDYTGNSLGLSLISSSNIGRVGPGICRINGYFLECTVEEDFAMPDPGTGTVTYFISAMYDPLLNVPDSVSGNADPLGPVRLTLSTNTLDFSSGKKHLVLWTVTRAAGTALSVATVVNHRKASGPVIVWPWDMPSPPAGSAALFPRGTIRYDRTYDRFLVRELNAAGSALEWRPVTLSDPLAFPTASGLVAFDAVPQYYFANGTEVQLRGTLKRSSGTALSTGSNVVLGTLPVAPIDIRRFLCDSVLASSGNHFAAAVKVDSTGAVTLYNPTSTIQWIDLSSIRFRVRA